MKIKILLFVVVLAAVFGFYAWQEHQKLCDYECLRDRLEEYLKALESKNVNALELGSKPTFTENGQTLEFPDGIWNTSTKINPEFRQYFIDENTANAGLFCLVEENGNLQIMALRLKIANHKIMEIEHIIVRSSIQMNAKPEMVKNSGVFDELQIGRERRNRKEMVIMINTYYDDLVSDSIVFSSFTEDCQRVENGNLTAGAVDAGKDNDAIILGLSQQLSSNHLSMVKRIRKRRFPIVDEKRGLAFVISYFDYPGIETVALQDGSIYTVPPPYNNPITTLKGELIKIIDGQISRIESVSIDLPYKIPSNW